MQNIKRHIQKIGKGNIISILIDSSLGVLSTNDCKLNLPYMITRLRRTETGQEYKGTLLFLNA